MINTDKTTIPPGSARTGKISFPCKITSLETSPFWECLQLFILDKISFSKQPHDRNCEPVIAHNMGGMGFLS